MSSTSKDGSCPFVPFFSRSQRPNLASNASDQGIWVVNSLTEVLNSESIAENDPMECCSVDSQCSAEREYLSGGRTRSGRISDPVTSARTHTTPCDPVVRVASTVEPLAPSSPSASDSISGQSRKVPPSERMLRFSPHAEVRYYDEGHGNRVSLE